MKFEIGERVRQTWSGRVGVLHSFASDLPPFGLWCRVQFPCSWSDEFSLVPVAHLERVTNQPNSLLAAAADVVSAWDLWPPDTEDKLYVYEDSPDVLARIVAELHEAIA
jgi:hypothetical protein